MSKVAKPIVSSTPPFKAFPEFTRLTLEHREPYINFIKQFPPLSDISFAKIIDWWEYFGEIGLSELNGSLVVSYENYTDERALGLSIIGKQNIDASICQLFDYLREGGYPVRLVNVMASLSRTLFIMFCMIKHTL
jgi:hypothetical protein